MYYSLCFLRGSGFHTERVHAVVVIKWMYREQVIDGRRELIVSRQQGQVLNRVLHHPCPFDEVNVIARGHRVWSGDVRAIGSV